MTITRGRWSDPSEQALQTTKRVAIENASLGFIAAANRLHSLYELSDEWNGLIAEYEKPEVDRDVVEAELDRVGSDIKRKAFGICSISQSIGNQIAEIKQEEERLARKRKGRENALADLHAYTLAQMKAMDVERIDTGIFTLSIQQNPPHVEVLDARAVPSNFQRSKVTIDVDKQAILRHVKATGEAVDGVELARTEKLVIS